jgi:hypothetical protein
VNHGATSVVERATVLHSADTRAAPFGRRELGTGAAVRHGSVDLLIRAPYGRLMTRRWAKLPPVMQRTVADDLRWALFVLAGASLGYLLFGGGAASILLGFIGGVLLAIVVLNGLRRLRRGP